MHDERMKLTLVDMWLPTTGHGAIVPVENRIALWFWEW